MRAENSQVVVRQKFILRARNTFPFLRAHTVERGASGVECADDCNFCIARQRVLQYSRQLGLAVRDELVASVDGSMRASACSQGETEPVGLSVQMTAILALPVREF